MTKPLIITSNNHAYARATYAIEAIYAFQFVVGFSDPRIMTAMHDLPVARIWALLLLLSATTAFVATYLPTSKFAEESSCKTEMWANVGLAVALGWQFVDILILGEKSVGGTLAFLIAAIYRVVQTYREVKRIKKSRANPTIVHDAFLGESDSK